MIPAAWFIIIEQRRSTLIAACYISFAKGQEELTCSLILDMRLKHSNVRLIENNMVPSRHQRLLVLVELRRQNINSPLVACLTLPSLLLQLGCPPGALQLFGYLDQQQLAQPVQMGWSDGANVYVAQPIKLTITNWDHWFVTCSCHVPTILTPKPK